MQNINEKLDSHDENDGRKIRESFEQNFQQSPPLPDLWVNIADALQKADGAPPLNPVANAFHDHYLAESQSPKSKKNVADAWQSVQAQLPKSKRKLQKYMAAFLLLLLLRQCSQGIGEATTGKTPNSVQNLAVASTIIKTNAKTNGSSQRFGNLLKEPQPQRDLTIDSRRLQPAAMNAVTHFYKNSVMSQTAKTTTKTITKFEKNNTTVNINNINTPTEIVPESLVRLPLPLAVVNPKTPLDSSVALIMPAINLEKETKKKTFTPSIELSLKAASNTPLFYGELSQKAFDPNSSNSTDFHTTLHLSLQGRYYFSPKQAVIAELSPMATYRQTFGEFESSGQYTKRSLRLVYRQISVGYQYQFRTIFLQAAAQFGYLSQSRETVSFSTAPSYKKMKYALSVATGQKLSFKKLCLSYGVAASLSLNNISKDSAIRLFSFSPFVGIGYNF